MAKPLISDRLWARIQPLLPPPTPKPRGGRPPIPDRAALTGIVFVLRTGLPWEYLPQEMGCGSGMTCWRRLRDWHQAGLWDKLHQVLLDQLGRGGHLDWSRAAADSASVRAKGGGLKTGRNPTDRGKLGSKHHLLVERQGIPLAPPVLSAANVHDSQVLDQLMDSVIPIKQAQGRPRKRPAKLHADKGYDYPRCRKACRRRGIKDRIARKGIESSQRLGRYRWVVERTLAWLHQLRRLMVRYERRDDIHEALLTLGSALIVWNFVVRFC